VPIAPDWRTRLLAIITDPNVAYLLMIIGLYGVIFEFMNPGFVLPGVLGGICLLLALYAFQALPFDYTGAALIALGMAFLIADLFVQSIVLGMGGLAALRHRLGDADRYRAAGLWHRLAGHHHAGRHDRDVFHGRTGHRD
jgi:membrane-bound ClpP family serine protease